MLSYRPALKTLLIAPYLVVILGTAVIIDALFYRAGSNAVDNLSGQLLTETVNRIAQAVERSHGDFEGLVANGDLTTPLTSTRNDELGSLTRKFGDMQRRLLTDTLTGLSKGETVVRHIEERVVQHRRRGDERPFAVIFVDLNAFKQVNDRYGLPGRRPRRATAAHSRRRRHVPAQAAFLNVPALSLLVSLSACQLGNRLTAWWPTAGKQFCSAPRRGNCSCGASSSSGASTKWRRCKRGCGRVSCGVWHTVLPQIKRSRSNVRGALRYGRWRPASFSIACSAASKTSGASDVRSCTTALMNSGPCASTGTDA